MSSSESGEFFQLIEGKVDEDSQYDHHFLPFIHSPEDKRLGEILKSNGLYPVTRNLFLFYGRPSYCLSRSDRVLRRYAFVVELDDSVVIDEIYPFDSGGFRSGRYANDPIGAYKIDQFRASPKRESVAELLVWFYKNNFRYFYCKPTMESAEEEKILRDYRSFIRKNSLEDMSRGIPLGVDVISHSVEVQLKQGLNFNGTLKAIVAPRMEFAQNGQLRAFARDSKVQILTYEYGTPNNFKAVRESIFSEIASFYKKNHGSVFCDV